MKYQLQTCWRKVCCQLKEWSTCQCWWWRGCKMRGCILQSWSSSTPCTGCCHLATLWSASTASPWARWWSRWWSRPGWGGTQGSQHWCDSWLEVCGTASWRWWARCCWESSQLKTSSYIIFSSLNLHWTTHYCQSKTLSSNFTDILHLLEIDFSSCL